MFNKISPTLTFTLEMEMNNSINFLDISIFRTNDSVQFKIYRKPTATHTLIPSDSNHPIAHKLSAILYLANRLLTYPMTDKNKLHEYKIKYILHKNNYHPDILDETITSINEKQLIQHEKSRTGTTTTQKKRPLSNT